MEEHYYLSIYFKYNPIYEIHGVKRYSRTFIHQVGCSCAHHGSVLWCSYSLVGTRLQHSPHKQTQPPPKDAFGKTEQTWPTEQANPIFEQPKSSEWNLYHPFLCSPNTSVYSFSLVRIILDVVVISFVKTVSPILDVMWMPRTNSSSLTPVISFPLNFWGLPAV